MRKIAKYMLFIMVFVTMEPLLSLSSGLANSSVCHHNCSAELVISFSNNLGFNNPHAIHSLDLSVDDTSNKSEQRCNPLLSCSACSSLIAVVYWNFFFSATYSPILNFPEPKMGLWSTYNNFWHPPQLI